MACLLLLATSARASEPQVERARAIFEEGRQAFEAERYQAAYEKFHEAYALAPAPALLFNMAAALGAMGRPGEAAERLRAFLRAAAAYPDRGAIEARIRSLDEAQRLIEVEKLRAERPRMLELGAVEQRGRRRGLAICLGVGGAVLVGVAIGLGIYFGSPPHYPGSTLGTQRGP